MKVINTDELPFVPREAFKHLQLTNDHTLSTTGVKTITYMEQQFENPIHTQHFRDRVSRQKIVLEQASKLFQTKFALFFYLMIFFLQMQ